LSLSTQPTWVKQQSEDERLSFHPLVINEDMSFFGWKGIALMSNLRAALITPLSGSLALFGHASAEGLTLWSKYAAQLPPPWSSVTLEVHNSTPDPAAAMRTVLASQPDIIFGPYGSHPMLTAMRVADRVVWNHGGATSQLCQSTFPLVINVLSPATTYFTGVLQAVRAVDASATRVTIFHTSTSFGKDVAIGAICAAAELHFESQVISFSPSHIQNEEIFLPPADVLLVAGSFADELAIAPLVLRLPWRATAFIGAGVDQVLATLGELREGLLGPTQWMPNATLEPDEGPTADWFVTKYRHMTGEDASYPATQAFAAGLLCARCLRDCGICEDTKQLATAHQLACRTLYGDFRIDPDNGLQIGHQVLTVQWQQGQRRVVWPPAQAERPLDYPLGIL
jgi:branched-chain amino acid transport system substrate-binding protein